MSNNKQTFKFNHNSNQSSVDWLIGEIFKHEMTFFGTASIPLRIIEQAKAMHKEEMDKVAGDYWNEGASYMHDGQRKYNSFDDYYNETFGGNK